MKFIIPENISTQKVRKLTEQLEKSDVKYGAWTLAFESMFANISAAELKLISDASEKIVRASEIFTNIVLESEKFKSEFDWSEEFWNLVSVSPGYSQNIPCSRFDAFLNKIPLTPFKKEGIENNPITPSVKGELSGKLSFIELNTDGCSGMTNADIFQKNYSEIFELSQYKCEKIVPHLIDTLLNCYKEFRENFPDSKLPKKPVVGILDWSDEDTFWEFEAMVKFLSDAGIESHIVSPEQADFDGNRLLFDGKEVHLIYRRLLGVDYANNLDKLTKVSAAFLERKICMVGSPRSQIAFSKKLYAFLQSAEILLKLPKEVAKAVGEHLPWTRILQKMETDFYGKIINLLPFIIENKDKFVLKPCVSKCGIGIYQGKFTEQNVWEKVVNDALKKDFIIQEFVDLPIAEFFRENEKKELRYIHLGAYVFGGKFSGFLGRTCGNPLLTLRYGERLMFIAKKKKKGLQECLEALLMMVVKWRRRPDSNR